MRAIKDESTKKKSCAAQKRRAGRNAEGGTAKPVESRRTRVGNQESSQPVSAAALQVFVSVRACACCVCAALSSTTQNTSQDTVKPRINMFVPILAACSS